MLQGPHKSIGKLAIVVPAAGVLLALAAGGLPEPLARAQETPDAQAELHDLLRSDALTRGQLAGLYASLAGVQYLPPACVAGEEMFTDVPAESPFCPWIEELSRRGITSGCTATQYCPGSPVSRAQMAVFIVRSMEACPTLDPTDEMIRVGGVCVDKYEASIWDAPVGGNRIKGAIPCAADGQDCINIYARSVASVPPRGGLTWFQAQAALANSGKRLPTSAEWQMAARGTPDDTGQETTLCNTRTGLLHNTGANAGCVSDWGAYDMVGNLWEWVAEWVPASTVCLDWGGLSDDYMCISGASTTTQGPGVLLRGGNWHNFSKAGPLAVSALNPPWDSFSDFGFRGAR